MRRFEFSDGKSNKFWQIHVSGSDLTTQWGRIGTQGQAKTKSFADEPAARAEMAKQIAAKTKKGYAEVGTPAASGATAVPAPKPAPAPVVAASGATATAAPAPKPAPTPVPVASPPPATPAASGATAAVPPSPLPPYESFVDLKALDRVPIRGQEPFKAPSTTGNLWTARSYDGLPPRFETMRQSLAKGIVPPGEASDHAELFVQLLALQRVYWLPAELVDPFGAADPLHALSVCTVLATRIPLSHACLLSLRVGSWLVEAEDAVFAQAQRWARELSNRQVNPSILACAALALRDREIADALVARKAPLPPELPPLCSAPEEVIGQSPPDYGTRTDIAVLLMQVHGTRADRALVAAWNSWPEWRQDELVKRMARCVTPTMARFFGAFQGTRAQTQVAQDYLDKHATLVLQIWGQEEPKHGTPAEAAFKAAVVNHPELARRAAVGGRSDIVEALLEGPGSIAPVEEWPAVLRDPPWQRKPLPRSTVDVVLDLDLPVPEPFIAWEPGEQERLAAPNRWGQQQTWGGGKVGWSDLAWRYDAAQVQRIYQAGVTPTGYLWGDLLLTVLAKVGLEGLPWMQEHTNFQQCQDALSRVASASLGPVMAEHYDRKSYKPLILTWCSRFPAHAMAGIAPVAFGASEVKLRQKAQFLLRDLLGANPDGVAALDLPAELRDALAALDDISPRNLLPTKRKKVASWVVPAFLPAVTLHSGENVGPDGVSALVEMIAFSPVDDPYVGIDEVREACTPRSLEAFALGLFELWLARGADGKDNYCLSAVGFFGGDKAANLITPMIRRWPGEAAHARAVLGLDVLRAIGTDVALMHLYGISQKLKFKGLKNKAAEKVQEIADARGLTAAELADRLVPDLGLDPDGSRWLDFGPRQFRVGFDEALKPWVADESGKRRANLPKPGAKDDAEKAAEATEAWKELKKSARNTAKSQLERLERAMVDQRRWKPEDWTRFFLEHPLMVHLSRRLVWGAVNAEGALVRTFRVDEGGGFADVEDEEFDLDALFAELGDDARISLPHRLDLDDAEAWGEVLGDYEILQPFDQLARPTFQRKPEEEDAVALTRVQGTVVHWGKVVGLDRRGWVKGEPQDAGCIWEYLKPLPGGLEASLELDPGLFAGAAEYNEDQKLGELWLRKAGAWHKQDRKTWGSVSAVTFSELVLDLSTLTEG
ncbi:MAG: DUF4132 domain-containing protein [Deltaproteobacteria bacterium]|nr:MAG: DUF4132 domain-containing protein [Deltaproteobacteria bacterium]